MQEKFDKEGVCVSADRRAQEMRTAIGLIDALTTKITFTYDTKINKEEGESLGMYFTRMVSTYRCLVNVNTRNVKRFFPGASESTIKFIKEHPHELYEKKAYSLLFKYLEHHLWDWWD